MKKARIQKYEGWHPWEDGEEYHPIQKVVGVKIGNKRITEYLILSESGKRWIPRGEAIKLAEKKMLRAVVVRRKDQVYL